MLRSTLLATILSGNLAVDEPVSLPLLHRMNRHSKRHGRHLTDLQADLLGSASDDYVAEFVIEDKTFHAIVDTGSDVFAVAGAPDLGCHSYVDTSHDCDRVPVKTVYGSGFWSGVQCWRDIHLGSLVVPAYEMSAIEAENNFLTCQPARVAEMLRSDFRSEGIIGLSLDGLRGATRTSTPLMYALFAAHPRLPRKFGLQCCAYDPLSGAGGTGAFDLGGEARR